MMKKLLILLLTLPLSLAVYSQSQDSLLIDSLVKDSLIKPSLIKPKYVHHYLDVSLSVGTTGVGIELATRLGKSIQFRAGYDYMPRINMNVYFPIEVGGQPAKLYDASGNRIESRFDRLSKMLTQITGYEVQDEVEMVPQKALVLNCWLLLGIFSVCLC